MPEPSDLLTAEQVATALGVHPTSVRRWANDGVIPAIRLPGPGRHIRIRRDTLDALLSQGAA